MYSVSCIMAVAMLTLMVGIGWNGYFGTGLVTSSVEAEGLQQDVEDEDTMEANMDAVLKLQPVVWEDLNTYERIDVLQTVCNVETHYLGLRDPVTVQGDNLSPYTLGAYSDAQRLIRINLDHIENDPVEDVLSTILHEIHHSYEHRLADVFNNISPEYLEALGIRVERTKNHVKLYCDGRLYTAPSSASDWRSGTNLASIICREM